MAVPAGVDAAGLYVELSYVDAVRPRRRRPPLDCVTARFEDVAPVRPFRWSRGERHFAGWYWSATTRHRVGFESWLERDRLLLMDFDPEVVGIALQPFWLHWHDGERERRHAPDYFVRRTDGSAAVVDLRADERIEPKDPEAFEVMRLACARAGWGPQRVGVPDAVLLANVRWLSRCRHPRCLQVPAAGRLREIFAAPGPLIAGADSAGDGRRRCRCSSICSGSGSCPPSGWRWSCLRLAPSWAWPRGWPVTGERRRVPPTSRIAEFPETAAEQARRWERHILEVLDGLPPDAPDGTPPRPEFDPKRHSLRGEPSVACAGLSDSC